MKKQNRIITVIGRKGCGKTTLAIKLMGEIRKQVFAVDNLYQLPGKHYTGYDQFARAAVAGKVTEPVVKFVLDPDQFEILTEYVLSRGNCVYFIDEIDMFDNPANKTLFKRVIHYGRHLCIDIISTSRRPANISRDLTSQTDEWYIFNMTEPNDLKYLKAISAELPDRVRVLPDYEHVKFGI